MKTFKILFLLCIISIQANAQKALVTGKIIDENTGETLIGASIAIESLNIGTITNENGEFELKVPVGTYKISVSYLGYDIKNQEIEINKKTNLDFKFKKSDISIDEVEISAKKDDENITSDKVGAVTINAKEINKLPSMFGEPDVIKAVKLTPGIQAGGEGDVGLYVRGGDAGQNLILFGDMPLYNPSHLLGLYSVFNTDAIDKVTVFKGAIPAYYGGKGASVIDIGMKNGSTDSFKGSGSVGILSSDLTLESPINNGKGSIIISGRQAYLNAIEYLVAPINNRASNFFETTNYTFTDLSAKVHYRLSKKDRVTISAYHGKDSYSLNDSTSNLQNGIDWGNTAANIQYNRVITPNIFVNVSAGLTNYKFDLNARFLDYNLSLKSNIQDYYGKIDFTHIFQTKGGLKYGLHYADHELIPNSLDANLEDISYENKTKYKTREISPYINGNYNLTDKLKLTSGIRYTLYQHTGPFTKYLDTNSLIEGDSIVYNKKEIVKSYHTIDPNISAVYLINKSSSVKGSVGITHQFIHLASVGSVSLPTDLWIPSTDFIKPQQVGIASIGYFRNFLNNEYETSIEAYYKNMQNQIEFLNGLIDNFDNSQFESNLLFGEGKAYGLEFMAKKTAGKLTGWVSYAISRTYRKFDEIGKDFFPAKYDRIHDLSATASYQLSKQWDVSATFIYATGNAMTLPTGRYIISGNLVNEYTSVNAFRMPAYHRLDLSANYHFKKRGRFESSLNFSIYNAYNRSNPYYVYFEVEGSIRQYQLSVKPKEISLFPILPSVTWNFKF